MRLQKKIATVAVSYFCLKVSNYLFKSLEVSKTDTTHGLYVVYSDLLNLQRRELLIQV